MTTMRSFGLAAALGLVACAPAVDRFPLREPMWRDTDLRPVTAQCRREPTPREPRHVSCAPKVRYDALIWDGADNLLFRPMSEALGVVVGRESVDVNSLDEVPDSSWFTNRIGVHPLSRAELTLGSCTTALILDGAGAADGTWVIDQGKTGGYSDGFRVDIPGQGKYLFKADEARTPEHSSAAQTIGAAMYFAAGYYTSCEQIVYFRPAALKLTPGLHWKHNFGDEQPFDQKALERVLGHCPHRDDLVRMQASAWVPGHTLGGFDYEGTRDDDPNDVVAHEDRRELRGKRVLDAWLDRFDDRSGNTLDSWIVEGDGPRDGSPGHVVHYQMDTSEALGSEWDWAEISRRLGYAYVVDWGEMAGDFVLLGARTRTWDTVERRPGKEAFGYFNVEDFVPDQWKNGYPVAAFSRMTERDAAWMARILARFTPDLVRDLAASARYSRPDETGYLTLVLQGRLQKILERYLTRLSSVTDLHVEGSNLLCGVDLAEWRGLRDPGAFRYSARRLGAKEWLPVERRAGAGICVVLQNAPPPGSDLADDAPERYLRVRIDDGVARGPLVAHLYDLGPDRGYRLAGIERLDPVEP